MFKSTNAETRKFIYDHQQLLQETDAADETQHDYTYSLNSEYGDLISEFGDDEESYHTYNAGGQCCFRNLGLQEAFVFASHFPRSLHPNSPDRWHADRLGCLQPED